MTAQQQLELYCIRDLKVNKFLPPFFASNREEATRLMREQVNYKSSLINSFPSDYELYFLGTFEDFTGEISCDNPQLVCNLESLKVDDSIKYDELLKKTQSLQANVEASVMRFNNAMADFTNQFNNFMKVCDKKLDIKLNSSELDSKNQKNHIIKSLFTHKTEKKKNTMTHTQMI